MNNPIFIDISQPPPLPTPPDGPDKAYQRFAEAIGYVHETAGRFCSEPKGPVMSPENIAKHNAMVARCNAMTVEEQDRLVAADRCPFEPDCLLGIPLGMFHCQICGEMVVAGLAHPRRDEPGPQPTPDPFDEQWEGRRK